MRVRPAALVALSFAIASSAADFPVAPGAPIADAVAKEAAQLGTILYPNTVGAVNLNLHQT